MRVFDVLVVLPPLIFLIVLVGAFGARHPALIVIIGVVFAPGIARIIRAAVLAEMGKKYVTTARLQGESAAPDHGRRAGAERLAHDHHPGHAEPVLGDLDDGHAVVPRPRPAAAIAGLGPAINQNLTYIETAWWTVVFPALAVASLVVAVQLIADNIKETWS